METQEMGRVLVTAKMENLEDLFQARKGAVKPEEVRSIEVTDALVDTGASTVSLPKRMIDQLGLTMQKSKRPRTAAGTTMIRVYDPIRLTIQGRDCSADVVELPDDCPVLIGQIPLEAMDWVVDMKHQKLVGNPDHGGEQMFELY